MSAFTEAKSLVHLYQKMPENERIILDVLRQIVRETLPEYCKEKLSFNVPLFYGIEQFASFGQPRFQEVALKKESYSAFGTEINLTTLIIT